MTDQHPPSSDVPPGSAWGAPPPSSPGTPGGAAPGWPPPPAGAAYPRPLHKPGTVPLRPLTLSDFFDGAFSTIRRNPRATIGMGALVTAAFLALPILGTILLGVTGQMGDMGLRSAGSGTTFTDAGVLVSSVVTSVFGLLANVVVAGLIVPVVTRATVGERVSTAAAWQQVRGRLVRLIGLSFLELVTVTAIVAAAAGAGLGVGLATREPVLEIVFALVGGAAGVLVALAVHVRWFQLAAPVLVVERRGVWASLGRSGRLGAGQFWRILGMFLLAWLLSIVVNQVISLPFSLLGVVLAFALPGSGGTVGLLLSANAASILSGAILAPFTGAVAVLQYLDQRFRKEGFDIELVDYVQGRGGRRRGTQASGRD